MGYPQLGFVLGSLAGSALFPTQLPQGPRIADNRTTTSAVGDPVALVFGTANVAGVVMWLAPYIEHTNSSGGKGTPQQKTFSYTQSIAIGLCERIDDDAPDAVTAIGGITRVWENGTLVYDIRPQLASNSDLGSIAETDQQYANRLTASEAYALTFTLHLGDELQMPDPTIEAIQGVGNVPAFRGLAYIVFPNRNLQLAQGQRHPSFQFEVYQAGTGACVDTTQYSNEVLYPWWDARNVYTYMVVLLTAPVPGADPHLYGAVFNDLASALAAAEAYTGINQSVLIGHNVTTDYAGFASTLVPLAGSVDIGAVVDGVTVDPTYVQTNYNFCYPTLGLQPAQDTYPVPSAPSLFKGPGNQWWEVNYLIKVTSASSTDDYAYPPWDFPYNDGSRCVDYFWFDQLIDLGLLQTRLPGPPASPCLGLTPSDVPGYAVNGSGFLVKCNDWVKDTSQTYKVLQQFTPSMGGGSTPNYVTKHPLNPCVPISDVLNYSNETFWTNAYNAAVADGKMAAGLVYGTDYPLEQAFGYVLDSVICDGTAGLARISDLIGAICKRSGLTAVDVSDLDAVTVDGYAIAAVCTGSSIISPLRSVGFFDAIESEGVLKFLTRGKPIVATFTTDDFGAYDATQSADPAKCPPSITTTRAQDVDLPRSIRFNYIATSRDYQNGQALSPFRLSTLAINDVDITVPICLGDVQAAKCADVLWSEAWAARNAYELAVDQSWLALDCGDCIGVPVDNLVERLRIVSDTNASGVLRKLSCVRDNQGAYISFALAATPQRLPQILSFIGPTSYELLDLPCLQDADSDPGFYACAQRANFDGTLWHGCVVYKSTDSGVTFIEEFSITTEATRGVLGSPVPSSEALFWDTTTIIDVTVPSVSVTFESVTDEAVLAGANAAAMGADRRWEIVQFATATQIDATHWHLSRLLRGRRGTEHVLGSSQVGDSFILVSTGDLKRIVLETVEIGAARLYKAVSIGASFGSGIDQTFSGHAQALECFSPVDLQAEQLSDGDISISWMRRSRLGRTLMSGVDIPLGETTEAFQVDILEVHSPASPQIVLRTLTTSSTSVLYSHANQETDFGSPLPSRIRVAVYQMSSIVGRGTPAIATLTVGG